MADTCGLDLCSILDTSRNHISLTRLSFHTISLGKHLRKTSSPSLNPSVFVVRVCVSGYALSLHV